jgi:hypothetical protein
MGHPKYLHWAILCLLIGIPFSNQKSFAGSTIDLNFSTVPLPMNPDGSPSCSAIPPTLFEAEYGVYLTGGYITNLSGTGGSASGSPCTGSAIGTGEVDSTLTTDQGSIGVSFDSSRVTNVSSIIFSGVTVLQGDGNGNYTVPAIQITGIPAGFIVSGNTITAPPGGSITSAIISAVPIAGYRDIPVISIHEIIIQEGQTFDLQAGTPQVSQTNAVVGSDGNLAVSPNTPLQINVPVSGSGFNNPELRSTTITLKAGSQPLQSQTISLADIQSGKITSVTFTVTFDPSLAGTTQTITATVDPGNALSESNFSDNMASVQVDVVGGYKIGLVVNGVPVPNSGGSLTLQPSIQACGALATSTPGATAVKVQCLNAATGAVSGTGCKNFFLDLSLGPDTGGHSHNMNDETRPFVFYSARSSFPAGSYQPFDSSGTTTLTYTPPELAGDVILELSGTDQSGKIISGPGYIFHIQDKTLVPMVSLNDVGTGLGPTGNNPGISVDSSPSHPGEGIFGTASMQKAVADLVQFYYENADNDGVSNPPGLASQAATMIEGGLFDANWNGDIYPSSPTPWDPPHCGHRNGATIDLSLSQFAGPSANQEKSWLQRAARSAGFIFTNPSESPGNLSANHWHAVLGALQ